jgi:hypothetical protein
MRRSSPLQPLSRQWTNPKVLDTGLAFSQDVAVYFPAYAGTKLYCLVTEARVRKQLSQGRYPDSNRAPRHSESGRVTDVATESHTRMN